MASARFWGSALLAALRWPRSAPVRTGLRSVCGRRRDGRGGRTPRLESLGRNSNFPESAPLVIAPCRDPRGDRLAAAAGGGADRTGRLGGGREPDRPHPRRVGPRRARRARRRRRGARSEHGRAPARPPLRPAGADSGRYRSLIVETHADHRVAERRLMQALVKDTDGFMARHVERPISLRISRLLAPTAITPDQMSLISMACRNLRRAVFPIPALLAANDRGASFPRPLDPGRLRRRIGEAQIPGIAMGRRA